MRRSKNKYFPYLRFVLPSSVMSGKTPYNFGMFDPSCTLCVGGDYPGRVQVKEGNYTGGGNNSRFVGRSEGNLGMSMPQWPVRNSNPIGAPSETAPLGWVILVGR